MLEQIATRVGSDSPLSSANFMDPLQRNPHMLCKSRLDDPEGLQKLFK
jgi:hypothetical protein